VLRILLDENTPVALKLLLIGHDARTVRDMGWIGLENGDLLNAAEAAGFEIMVTADQNIHHQQNMTRRKIALVVLSTSQWQTVRAGSELILQALKAVSEGMALLLNFGPECWRILAHPPPLNLRFVRLSRRNRSGLEIQGGIVRAAST